MAVGTSSHPTTQDAQALWLPLTDEVGTALLDYLRHGRLAFAARRITFSTALLEQDEKRRDAVRIGRLPKAILRASRNTFIVLLAGSQLGDAPSLFLQLWMHFHSLPLRRPLPDVHAPITANVFYRVFFPWIVLAILVVLPAFSGIRQGNRSLLLGRQTRVVLVTAATISLLILLIQVPGFGLLLGTAVREWLWRNRNAMQLLSLLSCWPMFYLIAIGQSNHCERTGSGYGLVR